MENKEILPEVIWNEAKMKTIDAFIKNHSDSQSKEIKTRNKLLAIQYKLEDYIEKEEMNENEMLEVLDFVKMYLKALGISKNDLARYFGMKDSNLHKYLTGKRKLNLELVLKLSSFSRTKPEYWYRVQIKNELYRLKKVHRIDYEKYDYENLLSFK
jgi:plasmid maintenance system antidote protein VapI